MIDWGGGLEDLCFLSLPRRYPVPEVKRNLAGQIRAGAQAKQGVSISRVLEK